MQNRIQPIEDSKKTVTALVQERVRQAILDGMLSPGSRIDQNKLATDLNVSLVPIREALKALEGEGFVVPETLKQARSNLGGDIGALSQETPGRHDRRKQTHQSRPSNYRCPEWIVVWKISVERKWERNK